MRHANTLLMCLAVSLMLTGVGFTQDPERVPRVRQRGAELKARANLQRLSAFVKQKLDPLIQHMSESLAQRYPLEEKDAKALRQSIFESVDIALDRDDAMRTLGIYARIGNNSGLLNSVLALPGCRAALASVLKKQQVQDYLDFLQARGERDKQAAAGLIVAWIDRQLGLTADQRQKMGPVILARIQKDVYEMNSMDLMGVDSEESAHMLRDFQIDRVLSPSQVTVWQLTTAKPGEKDEEDWRLKARFAAAEAGLKKAVAEGEITREQAGQRIEAMKKKFWGDKKDRGEEREVPDRREIQFREAAAKINGAVEAGHMTREQANERLGGLKRRLWAKDKDDRDEKSGAESDEQARRIAEATLAAHREQLGPLDARASKRLALVSKGVVEQYLESRDVDRGRGESKKRDNAFGQAAGKIQALVAAGRLTREQAVQKLEAMEEGWEEKKNGRRAQGAAAYITNNPLYQQTIKDCLSDDAYSDYRTRQVERLAFRQQALRDLVVAGLDTRLLLSHQQRQRFAETAAKLSAPKSGNVAGGIMLAQVVKQIDQGDLSDWQRGEFNSILRGRAKWKK
ncbi:MAG: hypothetical protein IIC50_04060 [Planctomycetes bacterium]|nr:hypothetical protein [Planctomycetota bacterium]